MAVLVFKKEYADDPESNYTEVFDTPADLVEHWSGFEPYAGYAELYMEDGYLEAFELRLCVELERITVSLAES